MMKWYDRIIQFLPIILIVGLLFVVMNKINSCNNNIPIVSPPVHVITQLTPSPVSVGDTAKVPAGREAVSVFKPTVKIASPRDKKIDVRFIIHTDPKCVTCTPGVTEDVIIKTKFGFVFEPKLYIGYTNSAPTIGYAQGFFRYGKTSLDALVTVPYLGIGGTYLITDNFFLLAGANTRYINYNSIEDVGSYALDLTGFTKIFPLVGAGFHF
jgi:hypothetical protein